MAGSLRLQRAVAARTVVVIPGGSRSIPQVFFDRLNTVVGRGVENPAALLFLHIPPYEARLYRRI